MDDSYAVKKAIFIINGVPAFSAFFLPIIERENKVRILKASEK